MISQRKTIKSKQLKQKVYDLSAPISEETVVYPGDPEFKAQKVCSLDEGHSFNLSHMHLGNHTGFVNSYL